MENLKELREERKRLSLEANALNERSIKEKRKLEPTEDAQWQKINDRLDEIDAIVEKNDAHEKRMAKYGQPEPRAGQPLPVDQRVDVDKAAIVKAYRNYLLNGETRDLQVTGNTKGGYLVPEQMMADGILKFIDNTVGVRAKATVYNVAGAQSLGKVTLDNDPSAFSWGTELAVATADTTMTFGKRELSPWDATLQIKVSRKLLRMAPAVEALVASRIAYLRGTNEEAAFMTGSGANQPLGIFTASNSGVPTTQDVTNASSQTTFEADKLFEAQYTLKEPARRNSVLITSRTGVRKIRTLKDGNDQYLWQPGLQAGEPNLVLGQPVMVSEYCPSTFTTGLYIGAWADLSYYYIADGMDIEIQRLDELYAGSGQIGYIARFATDGMPALAEAFVRIKTA